MADDVLVSHLAGLPAQIHPRSTLCMPADDYTSIAHDNDKRLLDQLQRNFAVNECNATERLVKLKRKLRKLRSDDFAKTLLEEICDIAGSQYSFIVKRVIHDDKDPSISVPPLGQPGSCLMSRAYYYTDGGDNAAFFANVTYPAFGTPCMYMRFNKTFVIPEKYLELCPANPNPLPFPPEAYIAVPLFKNEVCFAHLGMMWHKEGAAKRNLSWEYLEMLLYTLEDMVTDELLQSMPDTAPPAELAATTQKFKHYAPPEAAANALLLRPYARSLSHELRTPMQGVVGMLDVMYEAVNEAASIPSNNKVRKIFHSLRENIQIVQDSSRRAVEAADNVVQAYDMNMQIPETPKEIMNDSGSYFPPITAPVPTDPRPNILVEGHGLSITGKRRREDFDLQPIERPNVRIRLSDDAEEQSDFIIPNRPASADSLNMFNSIRDSPYENGLLPTPMTLDEAPSPGLHHAKIREAVKTSVLESLQSGGRPEVMDIKDTEYGQTIAYGPASNSAQLLIEWSVQPMVPIYIGIDVPEITKILSCVFHNAIKFTDAPGRITIDVSLSQFSKFLVVNVSDTGRGIPESFRPRLFRAFSQQDGSITRQKEGLGLGLLVSRGNARRLGGDIRLLRTDTAGERRGSEFEIQIPLHGPPTSTVSHDFDGSPPIGHAWRQHRTEPSLDSRSSRSASPRSAVVTTPPPLAAPKSVRMQTPPRTASLDYITSSNTGSVDTQPSSAPSAAPLRKLSFLIAEDNAINSKILVSMLRRLGHTAIMTAENGRDAVNIMEGLPLDKKIDVILMDLWMPHMDGYEASQNILAMERWKDKVTIMAVSADVTAEALERAAAVGMEGYMTKPYKMKDLERLITAYRASKEVMV